MIKRQDTQLLKKQSQQILHEDLALVRLIQNQCIKHSILLAGIEVTRALNNEITIKLNLVPMNHAVWPHGFRPRFHKPTTRPLFPLAQRSFSSLLNTTTWYG